LFSPGWIRLTLFRRKQFDKQWGVTIKLPSSGSAVKGKTGQNRIISIVTNAFRVDIKLSFFSAPALLKPVQIDRAKISFSNERGRKQ
jgi:hypothetical protein